MERPHEVSCDRSGSRGLPSGALAQGGAAVEAAAAGGDAAAGERVFRQCSACHQVGPNARTLLGPPLNGVVGAPLAHVEHYDYSDPFLAQAEEGRIWDVDFLSAYLAAPMETVPGTKMVYPGLRDDADIANVIAYLAQFAGE